MIFLVGISSGLLPLRFAVSKGEQLLFSIGNSLAGGIFLGAGLLHLLPDGIEFLSGVSDYPLAMLITASSLCVLLLLEKVVFIKSDAHNLENIGSSPDFQPYLLAIILSIHSFIAGAALGIEKTILASVVLFIAIIAHKGGAAFALGISMIRGGGDQEQTYKSDSPLQHYDPYRDISGFRIIKGIRQQYWRSS